MSRIIAHCLYWDAPKSQKRGDWLDDWLALELMCTLCGALDYWISKESASMKVPPSYENHLWSPAHYLHLGYEVNVADGSIEA